MIPVVDENVNPSSVLLAALEYVRNGWAVLPLMPRDKRPVGRLVPHGVADASRDESVVRAWFSDHPNLNIGIACGAASGELVVVDYDGGHDSYVPPEDAPYVRTPNRGYHVYYRNATGNKLSSYKHANGEVRSDGAYVLAPPSTHPNGGKYEWHNKAQALPRLDSADALPESNSPSVEPQQVDFTEPYDAERVAAAVLALPLYLYEYLIEDGVRDSADRSSVEWGLIHALIERECSDSDILYVFRTYLTTGSHYADHRRPLTYLSHSIGKARAAREQAAARGLATTGPLGGDVHIGESNSPRLVERVSGESERPAASSNGGSSTGGMGAHAAAPRTNSGWTIRTLSDAYSPRPPLRYVVGGLFTEASLNIVYGAPGSLKSMLLTDMMGAVVAGNLWLPRTLGEAGGYKTIQMPSLWIDYDNGTRRSDEHFEATGRWNNLPEDAPLYYMSMQMPWLNPKDARVMKMLKDFILSYNIGLVVMDNLGLVSGGADENSAEMIPVMGAYRALADETKACVTLVHHQSKTNATNRRGNGLRGFSGIEGALDQAYNVDREDVGSSFINIIPTKVRGAPIDPFAAQFTYEHKPGTLELHRAGFYGMEVKSATSDTAIRDTVIELLTQGGQAQNELVTQVKGQLDEKVGVNRIRAQIKLLVEERAIAEVNGSRNAKYYALLGD